jgi:hypothetical protein
VEFGFYYVCLQKEMLLTTTPGSGIEYVLEGFKAGEGDVLEGYCSD